MSQYSRPKAERGGALIGDARICADCGRRVTAGALYCSGCGVSFAGAPVPVGKGLESSRPLPGFWYHLVQGMGWGLGLFLASVVVGLFWLLVVALTVSLRH